MKNKFTILGCGSSLGSPWITNYKGRLKNNSKNIRTRCCAHIQYQNISILIDSSPDIKQQIKDNKIRMLLQIHDELIFEVPNNEVKNLCEIIQDEMISVKDSDLHSFTTPLTVDINTGDNWGILH